ncbi:NmrA family NAD(P)-binding protein [Nocardia blacklockiae]|uniref:NmrA family NAD(P)-binding protein n=1 Tax=Nocardia blacklockiae TaxID=480036 RepID=UPI001893BC4A|nr:NAD(P)H-binding protein [Nocardia blacklockiae]MBF6172224.1 NAD(P)H-binding protein [Nocardia blacklockiae]
MKILVTGATGNIGRKVVDHLIALGADDIRALSNHPERAGLPEGVEVVRGYLRRLSSLPAAFEGVQRMYLAPALETVTEVVELARQAGVGRIVDLSGDETTDWQPIAHAVEKSGVAWTHLYAGEFMENTTMWAEQGRTTGTVREPYPESANAPIAMDDIARVAATVLTQDGHDGIAYPLTGPETLTRAERVRQLGAALGRELTFETVPRADTVAALRPTMGDFAEWYVDGLAAMVDHPQQATTAVADLTGRPATTFAEWATANADLFR